MKRAGPGLRRTKGMGRSALIRLGPLTRKAPRSKYSNRRQSYDGNVYHSQKEAKYAAQLDLLMTCADPTMRVKRWERQVRIPLDVNGVHICNYICDFRVIFADGREEYHETKGFRTETWRLKERLFHACYPNAVLRVI